ncbi:hypothetical protein [Xenorhabdus bovienii]|uniref:hypothetical protein n=1 Tax=Xenorhabdus bovienii TaxID=40576 RepID=UPI003DA5405E
MAISMTFSVPNNTDLVIGQYFPLTITLTSTLHDTISPDASISFSSNINIECPSDKISLKRNKIDTSVAATVYLTVPSSTIEGAQIKFTVTASIPGVKPSNRQYTASTIDTESLSLTIENQYLDTPIKDHNNGPSAGKKIFTKVYTRIINKKKKALSGVPVFITSNQLDKLKDFEIYASDNTTLLDLQIIGPYNGVLINSGNDGNVTFYLYPQKSLSVILDLVSLLPEVLGGQVAAKNTIYVVNSQPVDFAHSLSWPHIMGFTSGNLTADAGLKNIYVAIDPYPEAASGDTILFFVNGNYTGYAFPIADPLHQLGSAFSFKLPYQIFGYGVSSSFSYVVIRPLADMLASNPLLLTYMGGVPYEPDQDVPRNYTRCIVHTSLGVNPNNIIPNYGGVDYTAIRKYPESKDKGLFIEILGTNDLTEKNKVPVGTDVTLKVYVNSVNKNFVNSYTKAVPTTADPKTGLSLIINIPYEVLVNVDPYTMSGLGSIEFDYEFSDGNKKQYGEIWQGEIETIPDDAGPNDRN